VKSSLEDGHMASIPETLFVVLPPEIPEMTKTKKRMKTHNNSMAG
jgi:hypothetical protein